MDGKTYSLYALPGVQKVKEMWQNPRNHDYPNSSHLMGEIDDVSNRLFCITRGDTFLYEDDPRDYDEYEWNFDVCNLPYATAKPFWQAAGWDLEGPDGDELNVADCFKRQIIAVLKDDLVRGAKFHPNGGGLAAYDWDGNYVGGADQFEDRLVSERNRWLDSKGKPPIVSPPFKFGKL